MSDPQQFLETGQNFLTTLAHASRQLQEWADSFTQRGGMETFGNDATLIAYLANELNNTFLDTGRRQLIARLRTDI